MRALALALILALGAAAAVAQAAGMTLASKDLKPGQPIAPAHIYPRCGGQNRSPELVWSGAPPGAKSFVVTAIDTSVRPNFWSHWIVVDLPPATTRLPAGAAQLPNGARAVAGNFGDVGYAGPCPPKGSGVHTYEFTVWALPTPRFEVAPDANARALAERLQRTALAHATLVGTVRG
jgi:Raf kinase inhibitor-like YbhB/YbcL family protein